MNNIAHPFNQVTGELQAPVICQESPREPGNYLKPRYSLFNEPPAPVEGMAIVVDNLDPDLASAWVLVTDNRGIWYTPGREQIEVLSLLDPIDPDWSREIPPLTVSELAADKLLSINNECEKDINAIKLGYPNSEVLSWPKQEAEARAYIVDSSAATPLLNALSVARGITKADLANRIVVKADQFAQISGMLIGKRQQLEDMINALLADNQNPPTAADIEAITW